MRHTRSIRPAYVLARLLAAAAVFGSVGAQAAPFQLIYTGVFNAQDALNLASAASPSHFSAPVDFTIHAWFDDSTPNYITSTIGPFAHFRAYAPSLATITIDQTVYRIENAVTNPSAGVTVAIFDGNSFPPVGHYAVGLLADPVADAMRRT